MTSCPIQFIKLNTMCRLVRLRFTASFESALRRYAKKLIAVEDIMEPVTEFNQYHLLEDVVTPLVRVPYQEQLKMKNVLVQECVKEMRKNLSMGNISAEILPIAPSPVIDHYRNKDEFNVRMGIDGDEKTFGLFIGKPDRGETFAVRPTNLRNIRQEHVTVLKVFEDFVKQSPLPPCYRLDDGGYWRRLLIRSNHKGDLMAVAVVHPRDRTPQELEDEKQQLVEHFINNNINIHSLYHQLCTHVKCTKKNSTQKLIHGAPYIYEKLLDHEFRISPDSFFQVNVKAAEILLDEVFKLAKFSSSTTLLDLCCGVGTFCISYHKHIKNCIGIEQCESSLDDALVNCSMNNVNNCEFSLGSVETRLTSAFEFLNHAGNIVVIANPGRSGLHPRSIELLRNNPTVNRIIYVSCRPTNPFTRRNFVSLLRNEKKTKAFELTTIKPVDMFPHTYHYELILVFER